MVKKEQYIVDQTTDMATFRPLLRTSDKKTDLNNFFFKHGALFDFTGSSMKNTVFNLKLKLVAQQKTDLLLEKLRTFSSSYLSRAYKFSLKFCLCFP